MDAPQEQLYSYDRRLGELAALRNFLGRDPCAARFGTETLSELLHAEGHLSHRIDPCGVECLLDALRVEGKVVP